MSDPLVFFFFLICYMSIVYAEGCRTEIKREKISREWKEEKGNEHKRKTIYSLKKKINSKRC